MKIAMIGAGYVGLVSGACLAEFGHEVVCADLDEMKVAALNDGQIPVFEPGLEQIVTMNRARNRLTFSTDLKRAVETAEVVFIADASLLSALTGYRPSTAIEEGLETFVDWYRNDYARL